ncbi:UDP-N-acetylmuramate dehydrogenase [Hwanghaeella sp.]|uniref:UDP-N-acetylmuramate dehydrogenase n=1 Tax=Hwanghaeella sp. TaxID=2605943 RepID=UPI003CCC27CD
MMSSAATTSHPPFDLPPVRGRVSFDAPLSKVTWFRVGGPADVVFRPEDVDDLCAFLAALPAEVPVLVIGVGSNLLVRDGGVRGVVIRLLGPFAGIEVDGDTVRAGAGALDQNVAKTAAKHGLTGLEFLSGIPGSIGGALRMNAGAYGAETKDVLISARAVDRQGKVHDVTAAEMGFDYRKSSVPADWIFTEALFRATPGNREEIEARMAEIAEKRADSQPIRSRTGGSTFKNPGALDPKGPKAWKLIDSVGGRGLTMGGAQVSNQHCNFLINTGEATAEDLERLGEELRAKVKEKTGIILEWEIKRVGETKDE